MLVVEWWPSFACPGSQAEGKRYHDWDGCIERITQLDSWPDVRTGSCPEMLRLSITGLLFGEKADAGAEVPVCQLGARSGLYIEGKGPRGGCNLLVCWWCK